MRLWTGQETREGALFTVCADESTDASAGGMTKKKHGPGIAIPKRLATLNKPKAKGTVRYWIGLTRDQLKAETEKRYPQ